MEHEAPHNPEPGTGVTRRDFLRSSAYGALGATIGLAGARRAGAQDDPKSRVVIVRDPGVLTDGEADAEGVAAMLDRGLAALLDKAPAEAWAGLFKPEDKVAIKTTLMLNRPRPQVLDAIHGALTTHAGVADEAVAAFDRNKAGFGRDQMHTMPRTFGLADDNISEVVHWSTALINLPALKRHWLSGTGIALKNWCGAVMGAINPADDDKAVFKIHGDSCAEMGILASQPAIRERLRLTIVDALTPFYGRGPQTDPRYFWEYGGLVLGLDEVAVDVVGTRILQDQVDEAEGRPTPISPPTKHIAIADEKYGLGTSDPERIEVVEV